MTETKKQWEPVGLERFAHLEDKIFRMVEAFKALRKENESLKAENQSLREEVETFRRTELSHNESLSNLQKEREELRGRVEKALSLLATVELR